MSNNSTVLFKQKCERGDSNPNDIEQGSYSSRGTREIEAPQQPKSILNEFRYSIVRLSNWISKKNCEGLEYTVFLQFTKVDDEKKYGEYSRNQIYAPMFYLYLFMVLIFFIGRLNSNLFHINALFFISNMFNIISLFLLLTYIFGYHLETLVGRKLPDIFQLYFDFVFHKIFCNEVESIMFLSTAISLVTILIARVLAGSCSTDSSLTINALSCNPLAGSNSPAMDDVMLCFMIPFLLQIFFKNVRKPVLLISWIISTITVWWSVIYMNAIFNQMWLFPCAISFFIFQYEFERINMSNFLKYQKSLSDEKLKLFEMESAYIEKLKILSELSDVKIKEKKSRMDLVILQLKSQMDAKLKEEETTQLRTIIDNKANMDTQIVEHIHTQFTSSLDSYNEHIFHLDSLPNMKTINENFTVANFANIEHLCNGSQSNIFKAKYENQNVILKVLLDLSTKHVVANDEFMKEIKALSKMSHPNILQIIGSGFTKSELFIGLQRPMIVVESLVGNTLDHHLSLKRSFNARPFTESRYLRMARELAAALMYIHDQINPECTLIHRDLKPNNIGFTKDGTLKLMDFGLAVCLRKGKSDIDGTYKLTGCTGSMRYMAPEVALSKPYNEKVDIYGFGMIIYQLITGVTPFLSYDKHTLYEKVINGEFRPDLQNDDYGREIKAHESLRTLIGKCWDDNHLNRPSAATIYDVLESINNEIESSNLSKSILRKSIQVTSELFSKKDSI